MYWCGGSYTTTVTTATNIDDSANIVTVNMWYTTERAHGRSRSTTSTIDLLLLNKNDWLATFYYTFWKILKDYLNLYLQLLGGVNR